MGLDKIGYNIKFFRCDQKNLSQKQLAEKMSVSRSTVSKWETNKLVPDLETLIKLSAEFGVTIDHIVGNLSFQKDLLKDFKRMYSSTSKTFDEEAVELVAYIMENPSFKKQVFRLRTLPIDKQKSIHSMLENLIINVESI